MAGFLPSDRFANVVHSFNAPNLNRPPSITFTVDNGGPVVTPNTLAVSLHQAFVSHMIEGLDSNWSLESTSVYVGPTPSVEAGSVVDVEPGLRTGASPPPQTAFLVRKHTGYVGRSARGRLYFPAGFLAEELIDESGNIQTAALNNFQAQINAWFAEVNAGVTMMLAHTGSPGSPPAADPYPITSLVADQLVATQRRRLR